MCDDVCVGVAGVVYGVVVNVHVVINSDVVDVSRRDTVAVDGCGCVDVTYDNGGVYIAV